MEYFIYLPNVIFPLMAYGYILLPIILIFRAAMNSELKFKFIWVVTMVLIFPIVAFIYGLLKESSRFLFYSCCLFSLLSLTVLADELGFIDIMGTLSNWLSE